MSWEFLIRRHVPRLDSHRLIGNTDSETEGWEMVPLGPFNSKNFGTSVSAWVVLIDALEPFRVRGIENENEVLPYMREEKKENVYDLNLEVELTSMGISLGCLLVC